jgi:hypothetical protein
VQAIRDAALRQPRAGHLWCPGDLGGEAASFVDAAGVERELQALDRRARAGRRWQLDAVAGVAGVRGDLGELSFA